VVQSRQVLNYFVNIAIRVKVKGYEMGWTGEMRNVYAIFVRKPEERDHLEDLGIEGEIILKRSLRK
jgi:hypothetical protein